MEKLDLNSGKNTESKCMYCDGDHRSYECRNVEVDIEKKKADYMENLKKGSAKKEKMSIEDESSVDPDKYQEQLREGKTGEIDERNRKLYKGTPLGE